MKKASLATSVFILLALSVSAYGAEDVSATKAVEEYVQRQFSADKDDMLQDEMAKYTKLTPALKEHVVDGVLYDFRSDPFILVSSYKVSQVDADSKQRKGSARVTYKRIGRGETYIFNESPHTKFISESEATEDVVFNLTKDNGKWFILDPGLPHVSCTAIKRLYSQYRTEEREREQRLKLKKTKGGLSERIRKDFQKIDDMKCE